MTAPETGREIPADPTTMAARLRALFIMDKAGRCDPLAQEAAALIEAQAAIMADLAARIASLEAERARTVGALQAIAGGAVPRRRAQLWRTDGQPSKHDCCEHTVPMYADCGECTANFAARALASEKGGQADE